MKRRGKKETIKKEKKKKKRKKEKTSKCNLEQCRNTLKLITGPFHKEK